MPADRPGMLALLTKTAEKHGRQPDEPLHQWFFNRRPRPRAAKRPGNTCTGATTPNWSGEILSDGFINTFTRYGNDSPEELRQDMSQRAGGGQPLLNCLPRHYAVTEKPYHASPVNWKILGDDLTELFRQYAQRDFADHREVSAWRYARHPVATDNPVHQWAKNPASREPLARLVTELGGDGHSVYRPNTRLFAELPEEVRERHTCPHPGCGSDEPGIYGFELMQSLPGPSTSIRTRSAGGSAMRELNQQLTRLLEHLQETAEATAAAA